MQSIQGSADQPFWMDEVNPYLAPSSRLGAVTNATAGLVALIRVVELLVLAGIGVLFALKYPVVWIFVVFELAILLVIAVRLGSALLRRRGHPNPVDIQRLARQQTDADMIGSALHIAGHPLLTVKQPVVLALRRDELSICSYDSALPITVLNVRDIQKVQTITYDDDYVPHADVVDGTAQVLQLTVSLRGSSYTFAFRRMNPVRPIEWYHALQAARWTYAEAMGSPQDAP